jgi:hypothetical protein
MRWSFRRDGAIALYDDTDINDDMLIVEPTVESFSPTRDGWCARCGGPFSFRCATDGVSEVFCFRCHTALARLNLGTRVHR